MSAAALRRRYPLLAALPAGAVADWLAGGVPRRLELGEMVFAAGDSGEHAYVVRSGRLRVLRNTKDGREVLFGTFGPGELVGEYALVPPGRNAATCRAADGGEALRLPLGPLREAVAGEPAVLAHLKRWLRLHAVLAYVRNKSFLGFMSAASLLPLLDRFQTVRLPAGRTVQADGLNDDGWFAVLDGALGVEGASGEFRPGDGFGEGALLGRPGLPVVETLTPAELMVLRRDCFLGDLGGPGGSSVQTHVSHAPRVDRSFPWVAQSEAADCGAAALAMVAKFHGLATDGCQLRRAVRVGPRGASMSELCRVAIGLGLRSQAVRVGVEQLPGVELPAIAHLSSGHYVVLYALGTQGIIIGDPSVGIRTLPVAAIQEVWTGQLLLLVSETGAIAPAR